MKIKTVTLETVCGPASRLPENTLPELAFAGRSNVGKSSLINTLIQRKALARTSAKPGKTQTINFYRVEAVPDDGALGFYLVDLPGYGYARRSKEESAKWGPMIERYLAHSKMLRAIFLLVDVRLKAQESDLQMLSYVRAAGVPHLLIATKADKLNKSELQKQTALLKEAFALTEEEPFLPFSAVKRTGLAELYEQVRERALPA